MEEKIRDINLSDEIVMAKIYVIRGIRVMLDKDLAELYQVETKQLKRAVRRNSGRFRDDFMFELSLKEFDNLRCQFGTSSWESVRYAPLAFSEQGVAMLSSVLNSEHAIRVNIQIIRIFTKMRDLIFSQEEILQRLEQLEKKDLEQDETIILIFEYLKKLKQTKLDESDFKIRNRIGFKQ